MAHLDLMGEVAEEKTDISARQVRRRHGQGTTYHPPYHSRESDFATSMDSQTGPFLFIRFTHEKTWADTSDFGAELCFTPYT